jgi:hypothetical protein
MRLAEFVHDAGPEQIRAWDESIPWLQRECNEVVRCDDTAKTYTAILEYRLPRDERRPDVIVLENGVVVVLELKGKAKPSQADLDQVSAYRRDLLCYHAECVDRPVLAVLVPTLAGPVPCRRDDVTVIGPGGVHDFLLACTRGHSAAPISAQAFLRPDAYAPLPSLVRAARDLFAREPLPFIKRARAATGPAVARLTEIAHEAARTKTRRLALLTGVPGAGKTLVGLQLVHSGFLDDLAVPRAGRKPASPAVFLSGNGPLVRVLRDALKGAGGGGRVFVQDVKKYVEQYSRNEGLSPPEHLLVFDEAQRAWDAEQVRAKHREGAGHAGERSEPEHFVEFAERIPDWCVVLGLIGTGQEIHVGEEGGLVQWRRALESVSGRDRWTVHAPAALEQVFAGSPVAAQWEPSLSLDTALRYHLAPEIQGFVESLLEDGDPAAARSFADRLHEGGHRLLLTRDLERAKRYARDRYAEAPLARFGLVASARDVLLEEHGMTGFVKWPRSLDVAKWFNAPPEDAKSCCQLRTVATEFDVQGLELDLAVLGWGSDYARRRGTWVVERYRPSRRKPVDLDRLRRNVHRVLLTRGRDGTVVFVAPDPWFDETFEFLLRCGVRPLEA